MEKLKKSFFELRNKIEEIAQKTYDEAEQEVIMDWGMTKTMKIISYFPEKGFGFAIAKGKKYFFHITNDVEYDRKLKEEPQVGQLILSFKEESNEKGPRIARWAKRSLLEEKMEEFKENFSIDDHVIYNMMEKFFFQNLSDEDILELGPASIQIKFNIPIAGVPIEINSTPFQVLLDGDEGRQELFLKVTCKQQERKVRIPTPCPFKKRDTYSRNITFSIGNIEEYKTIKNSIPGGVDVYIVKKGTEFLKLSKIEEPWSIDRDDRNLVLLQHPQTKILGATKEGYLRAQNKILSEEELSLDVSFVYFLKKYKSGRKTKLLPYLKFSASTEKQRVILNKSLPLLRTFLQDKWTEEWVQSLKESPEEFFIKKKKYSFSGNVRGDYYYLDENPLGEENLPMPEEGFLNFCFLDEEKVKEATNNILKMESEELKNKISKRNYYSSKYCHSYEEETQLHLRIPVGRERVKKILTSLTPGQGRIREFSFSEKIQREDNEILFSSLVGEGNSAQIDCVGVIDTQTGIVLLEGITGTSYGNWKRTVTLGGDGWVRGRRATIPITEKSFISTTIVFLHQNQINFDTKRRFGCSGHLLKGDEYELEAKKIENLLLKEDIFSILDKAFQLEERLYLETKAYNN